MNIMRTLSFWLCLAAMTACTEDTTQTQPGSGAYTVVDFDGKRISLTRPAKKIVALAPHVVENVFSAVAGDKLVGVVDYSNHPPQALNIPIVGGYEKANHEKIIEVDPDLIIAWQSGNSQAGINRLMDLGYPVYIDQPDTLRDVAKSIRDIGILSGSQDVAEPVAKQYLEQLDEVQQLYADKQKVTSFYQVWNEPLQTINGNHIISDAIEICGGINIYAEEFAVAPIINIESVLERDPLAIIASGMSSHRPEWLDSWLEWGSLTAVKYDNLFFVNPDHIQRHTVRLLLGIERICQQLDSARNKLSPSN